MSTPTLDFDLAYAELTAAALEERRQRLAPPLVRLWDGNWMLRGRLTRIISAEITEALNETGMATIELPMDYWMSEWVVDTDARSTDNVHLTVDKDGVRWSGRMQSFTVRKETDGTAVLVMIFRHDYQELKHIICYPNPALPPEVQFPRVFALYGPSKWALKLCLLLNVMRLESSAWTLPDDPLDPAGWFNFNQSTWSMVVAPDPIGLDTSLPALVHSRMKTMHDVSSKIVADAQLTWTFRRFLPGDPPPWPGANLRPGCLVIDLVDKSGAHSLTSFFGNLFDGLVKAFIGIDDDGLEDGVHIVTDPNSPPGQYTEDGFKGTVPEAPWVIYRDGPDTGIQTSEFTVTPATDVGVVAGGHSAPYVNEVIGAAIQTVGDLIAAAVVVPPIGGALDTMLKPLYTDCLSGDTVVHGPDGDERIDVLAERGTSFRVWSLAPDGRRCPAIAAFAFKKGQARLFRYVLDDGREVKVTAAHRFLTRAGWTEAQQVGVGTAIATVNHEMVAVTDTELVQPSDRIDDAEFVGVPDGEAVTYRQVVEVEALDIEDFYDLHVPGYVNYSAAGMWHHNTILAFGKWKNISRAQRLGWSRYHEHFAQGADKAYTLGWLLSMRAGMWATRGTTNHELVVADGAPYHIGAQGHGHFYLGDRVGSTVRGMPPGKIFVDRVTEVSLAWDRDRSPGWKITLGNRDIKDPVVKAWEMLQDTLSFIQELGVL
ncbi:hypothetical protein ACIGO9_28850 [Nocardia asteroides]|uniref:Gp37-like protein n=1 Tax=Nocardia asteroides TaxID=1824 RepID=UPI0037CB0AE9